VNSFIPYGKQSINESDIKAVVEILSSPFLTQGPKVPEFEEAVASIVNAKYSIAVNSATSALHIACLALELGPGEYLWTSPITFVASANCALYCGAKVDFVDVDANTGLMCIHALEQKLIDAKKTNKLPKVVIPVHLAGTSCDMKQIKQLSVEYGFSIVEDASHAIGGRFHSHWVGSCRYSDICVFSFHPVKIITTAEGGMATTNNPELARKMRLLRSHGITKNEDDFFQSDPPQWAYEQQLLGFNYRMTDIQAALGISQISRLSDFIAERNRLLAKYDHYLQDFELDILDIPEGVYSAVHLCIVRLQSHLKHKKRTIFDLVRAQNIGVQVHYTPVHLQPYYQQLGFQLGDFPVAEEFSALIFSIPLFPGLEASHQAMVIDAIKKAL